MTARRLSGLEEFRPSGEGSNLGVRLPDDLEDGTYTVTYRVISADSHPVSGGFVFSVGEAGAAPAESVSELLDDTDASTSTQAAATVARFLTYAATALAVGVLAFSLFVFLPAAGRVRGASESWRLADDAFATQARTLVRVAVLAGLVGGALGIVCQGAIAGGTSVWAAVDASVIGDVLSTRFGTVWGIRELAWVAIGAATMGAQALSRARLALLALPLGFVIVAPSLAGHASTFSPEWLLIPANIVHVAVMSVWVGGVAALAIAVRAATRKLEPADRSRLLAATLTRFSPLALGSVAVIAATGAIQSIAYLESVSDLWETGFGRAIAAKIILLGALIAVGVIHRRRTLPLLREAAEGDMAPERGGKVAMRALRSELAIFVVVLTATALLVGEPPPGSAAEGPQSASTTIGDARLDVTVDPALAGSNDVHLYLFDSEDGSQYDELRAVELTATMPENEIGPLQIELRRAGPGHYTAPDAALGVSGEWELTFSGRLSRFEEARAVVDVPIE